LKPKELYSSEGKKTTMKIVLKQDETGIFFTPDFYIDFPGWKEHFFYEVDNSKRIFRFKAKKMQEFQRALRFLENVVEKVEYDEKAIENYFKLEESRHVENFAKVKPGVPIDIWTDGLCEPFNPGGCGAYGFVIYQKNTLIRKGMGALGFKYTNNKAEYVALIEALNSLTDEERNEEIRIKTDSMLVAKQLRGEYKVRSSNIVPLYHKVRMLLNKLRWNIKHVPRDENKEADELSRRAYEHYMSAIKI
jgi:ribonuclease HI